MGVKKRDWVGGGVPEGARKRFFYKITLVVLPGRVFFSGDSAARVEVRVGEVFQFLATTPRRNDVLWFSRALSPGQGDGYASLALVSRAGYYRW
jgi:hypothetical protein